MAKLEHTPRALKAIVDSKREGQTAAERVDEVGDPIRFHRAFTVKTAEQLAEVLEFAAERDCVVTPIGAHSSSGSFKHLTDAWLAAHRKKGVVMVSFAGTKDSEFAKIELDEAGKRARVGAAVNLAQLSKFVEDSTDGRLINPMTITTMNAKLVATFVGSGGVSDYCRSMSDLMYEATWMDGRLDANAVNHNTFDPSTYFDYGSYKRVDPDRIPLDMSGRGGPFGIGMHVGIRLEDAPLSKDRVVINFNANGDKYEVHKRFLEFITHVNRTARNFGDHLKVRPLGMEIMDQDTIKMLAHRGKRFKELPDTAQISLIMDLVQSKEDGGEIMDGWDKLSWLHGEGIFPNEVWESIMDGEEAYTMTPLTSSDGIALEGFRLAGPDEARWLIKNGYTGEKIYKTSTDFAVAAWESDLVLRYGMDHFRLMESIREQLKSDGSEGFLPGYGHGSWRYDPHGRLLTTNKDLFNQYVAGKRELGKWVVERIREGRSVRVRGEKPEQPGGLDAEIISAGRLEQHVDANLAIFKKHDPNGLFMHRDASRR